MRAQFYIIFTVVLGTFITCRSDKTPISTTHSKITLSADYVAVTEVWLKVELENSPGNVQVKIWRDTTIVFTGSFSGTDTTVVDTGLLPAHNYTYHSAILENSKILVNSPPLKITTMDTTSHDFQWEIIEFPSPYGSGALYDVAIISPTDIWAVGEIYSDSAQPWVPYNAVHWNGNEWKLKKIKTKSCGGVEYPPIRTILSFSSNNIIFAHIDASITTYNGNSFVNDCSFIQQINGSINKMWGINNNDLYVVGDDGIIAHYNGSDWRKIESGTQTMIQDIWGSKYPRMGGWEILCAISPAYSASGAGILRIKKDNSVESIPWVAGRSAESVWFDNPLIIYACGSGIFRKTLSGEWEEIGGTGVIPANTERLRGVALNDFFVVSDFGHIAHYNGFDFKVIQPDPGILYYSCDYKDNLMIGVGGFHKAYIIKMWR